MDKPFSLTTPQNSDYFREEYIRTFRPPRKRRYQIGTTQDEDEIHKVEGGKDFISRIKQKTTI